MKAKLKKIAEKILPKNLIDFRTKKLQLRNLTRLYKFDEKRHKTSAYELNDSWTFNNLRSKITYHYHSIEKGLSQPNIRFNFGDNAFNELFFAMDKYLELGYSTEDSRFQQAISVIEEYIKLHEENNIPTDWVSSKIEKYLPYMQKNNENNIGGYGKFSKVDMLDYSKINFKELAYGRHSIRDFGFEPVDNEKINESIGIATKTPTVCNRQAYHVYRIKNKEILKAAFYLQGGLTTHGENLQELLLVTSNREYMRGENERNQTYIDGGMFLMSLIYALTYNNIATCTLNTSFILEKEKEVRGLLNINVTEDLIAFVAIGSYKEENKYAISPRDSFEQVTTIIE